MSLVGARVVRKEDPKLLTGRGMFCDDVKLPNTAFMQFVMSTEPHAKLRAIDTSKAAALPGVCGVYTAADVAEYPDLPGPEGMMRPLLARDTVRFVGEPVAVVVAENRYVAADATAAVRVDYEPLPAVATIDDAVRPGAPIVLPGQTSNVVAQVAADSLATAFAQAPQRASLRLTNNRCAPVPIEPMCCVANAVDGEVTVYASIQAPHHLRHALSKWLGIPQHLCRIIAPDVGGGFGNKMVSYPELFLTPILSMRLGRPVKSLLTRSEAMLLMDHGRDQVHDLEVGFDDHGRILALRMFVTQNVGAWPDPTGMGLAVLTNWMAAGCYKIPEVATGFRNVVTNTTPIAAYRGAGRPEASYAIERIIDLVADRTGLDPVAVRMTNFIGPDEFPYQQNTDPAVVYDSGNYQQTLQELLRIMDYPALKQEQAQRRNDPSQPLMGIGLSVWLEVAGFGPAGSLEAFGHMASWESVQVRMQPDGSVIIYVGSSPHGQGHATVFAQIAADELGIDFDNIRVRHGDTETVPQGVGTFGSRAITTAGVGVKHVCEQIRARAQKIAAHLMEVAVDDVELRSGGFAVAGVSEVQTTWAEVALASFLPLSVPAGMAVGSLEERVYQQTPNFSYPSGAYGCVVQVDRDTGQVTVEKFYLVDDCGTVINPLLAQGQVHGGAAQGIAQALQEHMRYDDNARPVTTTLENYMIPTAPDVPTFVEGRMCTPTPNNVLGAKGIGESGAVGSPPAVVNAVVDALSHLGVTHIDMPMTGENVWRAMNAAKESR